MSGASDQTSSQSPLRARASFAGCCCVSVPRIEAMCARCEDVALKPRSSGATASSNVCRVGSTAADEPRASSSADSIRCSPSCSPSHLPGKGRTFRFYLLLSTLS
eukprot:scaffold250948_cov40-Tisochrysis_lutea.AAC.1